MRTGEVCDTGVCSIKTINNEIVNKFLVSFGPIASQTSL